MGLVIPARARVVVDSIFGSAVIAESDLDAGCHDPHSFPHLPFRPTSIVVGCRRDHRAPNRKPTCWIPLVCPAAYLDHFERACVHQSFNQVSSVPTEELLSFVAAILRSVVFRSNIFLLYRVVKEFVPRPCSDFYQQIAPMVVL